MQQEEDLKQKITDRFDLPADAITVQRRNRIVMMVPVERFVDVFEYLLHDLGFRILHTITGLDEVTQYTAIYHLSADNRIVINLKVAVPKEAPVIPSITRYLPNADIYEREILDLLGIAFEGLDEGRRYPLPETWPAGDHPLRKDWKPADEGSR